MLIINHEMNVNNKSLITIFLFLWCFTLKQNAKADAKLMSAWPVEGETEV